MRARHFMIESILQRVLNGFDFDFLQGSSWWSLHEDGEGLRNTKKSPRSRLKKQKKSCRSVCSSWNARIETQNRQTTPGVSLGRQQHMIQFISQVSKLQKEPNPQRDDFSCRTDEPVWAVRNTICICFGLQTNDATTHPTPCFSKAQDERDKVDDDDTVFACVKIACAAVPIPTMEQTRKKNLQVQSRLGLENSRNSPTGRHHIPLLWPHFRHHVLKLVPIQAEKKSINPVLISKQLVMFWMIKVAHKGTVVRL